MPGSAFVNGHALLVGVGADLPVTVQDAIALRDVLVDPGRAAYPPGQVKLLTEADANRDNVLTGFDDLIQRVDGDQDAVAMVYFSGHGVEYQRSGQAPEYFLLTHGYDMAHLAQTSVSGAEFTAKLERLRPRRMLVFLDCCHAGGMPQFKEPGSTLVKAPLPPELMQALGRGMGSVVVASSQEREKSYYGEKYSVFTECLLEALAGRGAIAQDGFARVLPVLSYLLREVPRRAQGPQNPLVKRISDLGDDFPICYYAGGDKGLPATFGVPVPPTYQRGLPDYERRAQQSKRASLVYHHDILAEQIAALLRASATEVNTVHKVVHQQQLLDLEAKIAQVGREIADIDRALQ